MTTAAGHGGPDDLTVDLRVAQSTGRIDTTMVSGLAALRRVSGKVYDERGLPMPALHLVVYHVGFRCDGVQLGAATTGSDGAYVVEYQRDGVVNLQIRAADERGAEAALSQPKYRAADKEIINLVCPGSVRAAASEHERLLADLAAHVGRESLAEARQDGDCRDISMLSGSTGWDGRVVALAAHAERLSRETGVPGDVADQLTYEAGMVSRVGGYARRELEWSFQSNTIAGEIEVTYKQLRAAQIREAIAQREYENHLQQMKNAVEVEQFLNGEKAGVEKYRKTTTLAF